MIKIGLATKQENGEYKIFAQHKGINREKYHVREKYHISEEGEWLPILFYIEDFVLEDSFLIDMSKIYNLQGSQGAVFLQYYEDDELLSEFGVKFDSLNVSDLLIHHRLLLFIISSNNTSLWSISVNEDGETICLNDEIVVKEGTKSEFLLINVDRRS